MKATPLHPSSFALLVWLALVTTPVSAQPMPDLESRPAAPWEQGVSQERQQRALQLFNEAASLLKQSQFIAAETKYRSALELWDHPAIHYNLAQILSRQGDRLSCHDHLTQAMKYGPAPFGDTYFSRAVALKKFTEEHLSEVDITCEAPDASVWLDEKRLFTCPGHTKLFVLPGDHVISARRDGFPANDRPRKLVAGKTLSLRIGTIYDSADMQYKEGRWARWKPWAAVGTGLALVAGGGALHVAARNNYNNFDTTAKNCGTGGCDPDPSKSRLVPKGNSLQRYALGTYALGGAIGMTGVVLTLLNETRTATHTPDEMDGAHFAFMATGKESGFLAFLRF